MCTFSVDVFYKKQTDSGKQKRKNYQPKRKVNIAEEGKTVTVTDSKPKEVKCGKGKDLSLIEEGRKDINCGCVYSVDVLLITRNI